jgi:hypothetical protein
MSRAEMDKLGWDSCDIVLVTGDAYVDHPSFGMAVIGRMLEAQGFRVGIIAQPDWNSAAPFKVLGKPNLFWGVTAGNMDSMINRYTADRKIRSDDAYTPGDIGGKRPDRAAIVYSQRCREAFKDVPIVLGGIEGSLRRIAHYDYWSDKVRRSIVVDAKCDLLLYGNAERAIVEIAHRLAAREPVQSITDVRGTAFVRRPDDPSGKDWIEIDSSSVDLPGRVEAHYNPYMTTSELAIENGATCARDDEAAQVAQAAEQQGAAKRAAPLVKAASQLGAQAQTMVFVPNPALKGKLQVPPRERSVIRLPSYEQVRSDPVLYAQINGTGARIVTVEPPIALPEGGCAFRFALPIHPTDLTESGLSVMLMLVGQEAPIGSFAWTRRGIDHVGLMGDGSRTHAEPVQSTDPLVLGRVGGVLGERAEVPDVGIVLIPARIEAARPARARRDGPLARPHAARARHRALRPAQRAAPHRSHHR